MTCPENREKMRKIILVLQPEALSYNSDFCMDPHIWDSLLGGLTIVGIIVAQPESPSGDPSEWSQEEQKDAFQKRALWLRRIMDYLGQALPMAANIVVDTNEEEDTIQICEKGLPGRCRFQRLRAAEYIFRRGEFSRDPDADSGPRATDPELDAEMDSEIDSDSVDLDN